MRGIYKHNCSHCGEVIEIEVDVGEHYSDIPDNCDHCQKTLSKKEKMELYTKSQEDVLSSAVDRALDLYRDR